MPRGVPGSGASGRGKSSGRSLTLDENTIRQIAALGNLGLSKSVVAAKLGIQLNTMNYWFLQGKKHLNKPPGEKPTVNGAIYGKLVREWRKACANAEESCVRGILTAGQRQWQANAWVLERRWPERWADRGPMLRALDREFEKLVEDTRKAAEGGTGEVPKDAPGH